LDAVYEAFFIKHVHGLGKTLATQTELAANIERVHVKVNGDTLIDLTGSEVLAWNAFYQIPAIDGYLVLPFSRPEFLDIREDLRYALGTLDVTQVSVEVTLAATVVAPVLTMWAKLTHGVKRPMGQLIRIRSTSYGAQASAGVIELDNLPIKGPEIGRGIKALHITAANILAHEVIRQGVPINEAEKELLNLWMDLKAFQTVSRTPQIGYYHIDFAGNRGTGIISTQNISDFRLKLTFGAANPAFKVIVEETIGQADV